MGYHHAKKNEILGIDLLTSAPLFLTSAAAEQVGEVGVGWFGNDIVIETLSDPEVQGVTCHLAYFDRGVFDRLQNGYWFEDPSNSPIACRQTGPIVIGDIERDEIGEEVFKSRRSILFKKLVVKRIFDLANKTLIYLSQSREVENGSAKMSILTVPLVPFFQPGK